MTTFVAGGTGFIGRRAVIFRRRVEQRLVAQGQETSHQRAGCESSVHLRRHEDRRLAHLLRQGVRLQPRRELVEQDARLVIARRGCVLLRSEQQVVGFRALSLVALASVVQVARLDRYERHGSDEQS